MEEFAERTKKIARLGLLIFISILFSQKNFAQIFRRVINVDGENFLFEADEEIFVNQNAVFKLFVPGVEASDVRMELPRFPENVIFVSSRSENFSSPKFGRGTQIELELNFAKAGIFSLSPISLFVNGRKKTASFPDVEVLQNPETILPRAFFVFGDGYFWTHVFFSDASSFPNLSLERGVALRFTVYVQYATALGQVSWSLPKDAIFKELQRFEIPSDFKFSKPIPVAQFEWTPLSEGNVSLPKIQVAAESYSGQKIVLETPDCEVKIISQKQAVKKMFGRILFRTRKRFLSMRSISKAANMERILKMPRPKTTRF